MVKSLFTCILTILLILPAPFIRAHAKDTAWIADINQAFWEENSLAGFVYSDGDPVEDAQALEVLPGEEVLISLPPEAFSGSFGSSAEANSFSSAALSEGKIGVRYKVLAGQQALDGITVSGRGADPSVSIRFQKELVQTQELDFEVLLYLTLDGKRMAETEFTVAGTVCNPVMLVNNGDRFVDLSGGKVAEATGFVKNISVHLGGGLSIRSSFFEGSRYYGAASVEESDGMTALLDDYPEVRLIYSLKTIGLKKDAGDIVSFDLPELYYAYDSEGFYIGTTDEGLPYSAKYYLASSYVGRIDLWDIF